MKKGIFLIAILLLPSVVYLLFSLGQHNTAKLKSYGAVLEVSSDGDTVFQSVKFPPLKQTDGSELEPEFISGKTVLVHRFDWPCTEDCLDGIATLNNYLNKVGLHDEWILVSVTNGDIESDELNRLSNQNMYEGGNWHFVSADKVDELQLQLFIETGRANDLGKIIKSEVALLDQKQVVRGFFNLKFQQDNKRLQDAIKVLIQEPHISWKENRRK